MGYADGDKIDTLYELRFNETLPTYLYTLRYTAPSRADASLVLDSSNRTGRVTFGDDLSYTALGEYKYENARLIFTTTDSFELKLVFKDVGGALIYSEKESDTHGLSGLFPDGIAFHGYYQLYVSALCTKWFDINDDGNQELIYANIGNSSLWYFVHALGETLASDTVPFTKYDDIRFEEAGGELYLVCEYSSVDFNSYRYKVSFDGENLIFTQEA